MLMQKGAMCVGFRRNFKSVTYMMPWDLNVLFNHMRLNTGVSIKAMYFEQNT